jgi:hypothetical protein
MRLGAAGCGWARLKIRKVNNFVCGWVRLLAAGCGWMRLVVEGKMAISGELP